VAITVLVTQKLRNPTLLLNPSLLRLPDLVRLIEQVSHYLPANHRIA
jgi:hypothetical protein